MPPRRFQFRLQTVLEYKQKREEEEQRELGRLLEILGREQSRLEGLKHLQQARQEELAEKSAAGRLDVGELQRYHEYEKRIEKEIAAQAIRVQQAEMDVEEQRQRLLEAAKEKKIYEKLKEKHHDVYIAETEAEERKLLDDLATSKFVHDKEKFF